MKKNCNLEIEFKKALSVSFIVLTGVFIGTLINAYLAVNSQHISELFTVLFFRFSFLFTFSVFYILVMFYIGLSAFGQPIILFLMLIYGAFLGFISSNVFLLYSFYGFKINALYLTPYLIIHSFGMILSATNSINMSCLISQLLTCDGTIANKRESFKVYFSKNLLFAFIVFISFAIKAIMYYFFN